MHQQAQAKAHFSKKIVGTNKQENHAHLAVYQHDKRNCRCRYWWQQAARLEVAGQPYDDSDVSAR